MFLLYRSIKMQCTRGNDMASSWLERKQRGKVVHFVVCTNCREWSTCSEDDVIKRLMHLY